MAGATLLDAFNAAAGFTTQAANYMDSQLREKARNDLTTMQLNFEKDSNDFLMNLSQRGDYDNFQKDTDTFLNNYRNKLQKESANAYTARLADQMLGSARNDMQIKVAQSVSTSRRNDMTKQDADNLGLCKQIYSGQSCVDKQSEILDRGYADGRYSTQQYQTSIISEAYEAAKLDYKTAGLKAVAESIKSGGTKEDVLAAMDRIESNITAKFIQSGTANIETLDKGNARYVDATNLIDKEKAKNSAKQEVEAIWETEVVSMQKKNESSLSEIYNSMLIPDANMYVIAKQGLRTVSSMGGNKLTSETRVKYTNYFNKILSDVAAGKDAKGSAIDNTLSTPSGAEAFVKVLWSQGGKTGYETQRAYNDAALKEFRSYSSNPDAQMGDMYLDKKFAKTMNFMDALQNAYPEGAKGIMDSQKNLINALCKAKNEDNAGEAEMIYSQELEYLWDSFNELKSADFTPEKLKEIKDKSTARINGLLGDTLNLVRINPETGKSKYEYGVFTSDERLMAKAIQQRDSTDIAYTDENGKKRFLQGTQEGLKPLENAEKNMVMQLSGVTDESDISAFNESTKSGDDINARNIYQTPDGSQYRFSSADGKKITVEKKSGVNGEWQKIDTPKTAEKKENKEIKRQERKTVKTADEISVNDAIEKSQGKPPKSNITNWDSLPESGKQMILQQIKKDNPKEFLNWYNNL